MIAGSEIENGAASSLTDLSLFSGLAAADSLVPGAAMCPGLSVALLQRLPGQPVV